MNGVEWKKISQIISSSSSHHITDHHIYDTSIITFYIIVHSNLSLNLKATGKQTNKETNKVHKIK